LFIFFSCTTKKEKNSYPADNDNTEFRKSSGIEIETLSNEQTENLVILGKIWGFLKYYHPAIAKGDYNWDYELFRILPEILNIEYKQQRDSVLMDWIEKLGNFKQGNILKENKNIVIYPDLNWIDSSGFDPKLVTLLQKVKNAKRTSEHYYIELAPFIENPIFKNENKYSNMSFPDVGYRLLSLFRYWNMINYYFPYKNLTDTPWKEVLPEFIPKFINAKNKFEYRLTALEMVTKINDSHAFFYGLDLYSESNIVPIEIVFVGDTAVVAGFFKKDFEKSTELKKGDIILKINDKSIDDMIHERKKYMPASNRGALLRDMASNLLQTDKKSLQIEYSNGFGTRQTKVSAYNKWSISIPDKFHKTDTCFKFIDINISYLYLGSIKNEYLPDLWNYIENSKGLIIDLRSYPKDVSVMKYLSNYLMKNCTAFVKGSYGSIMHPGTFTYTKNYTVGKNNKQYYKGKVAILINEITQSHAELSAVAYSMAPNAKLFGSPTAGADGNISSINLPGGMEITISGIGIYYPNGGKTQRVGILPDVEVKPTIKGIKEGRDEVLEKAIEWIKEK
jgi:C-terminal processing protease CtpA/Prc